MIAALLFALAVYPASDPHIAYIGRFEASDPAMRTCQWSASEVRAKLDGKTLVVHGEETGQDWWQIVIDGKPTQKVLMSGGHFDTSIEVGEGGTHEIELVKRTEAGIGTTTFTGFETPDGNLLQAAPKQRRIEVIGDSITCGFGNEGSNQNDNFKPETENAYMSYASIAAREVNADVTIIAWSGRKMWPDFTIPEIYDFILPAKKAGLYGFSHGPMPDAVVINLATNDFGKDNPDETAWTGAYESFIKRIWSHYPKAQVYAAVGSMMSDDWPSGHHALSTVRGYLTRMIQRMNDPRLHFIEFDQQKMEDGIGAAWHPSVKTDRKMGDKLAAALRHDLNW